MIETVQIKIGQELAGEITDRNAFAPGCGRKKIVSRKITAHRFLLIAGIDDRIDQP